MLLLLRQILYVVVYSCAINQFKMSRALLHRAELQPEVGASGGGGPHEEAVQGAGQPGRDRRLHRWSSQKIFAKNIPLPPEKKKKKPFFSM